MVSIRLLESSDIQPIAEVFARLGWHKPASQYEKYLSEQEKGERVVLAALAQNVFAGYVTICWQSHYPPFHATGIPEIVDFNVLPDFRCQGIGTLLMDEAERRVAKVSSVVGIGVGMTAGYGSAQRMYVKRGYIPDGRGLMAGDAPVEYGKQAMVDDDLCLWFTKELRSTSEK